MAGFISEFFGYRSEDSSQVAVGAAARKECPFIGEFCSKLLAREREEAGVCSVRQKTPGSPNVICCPIRLYADNYKLLYEISRKAFSCEQSLYAGRAAVEKAKMEGGAIAVFGKGWGGELRLPQRKGVGSYFVDWVLARLDGSGE